VINLDFLLDSFQNHTSWQKVTSQKSKIAASTCILKLLYFFFHLTLFFAKYIILFMLFGSDSVLNHRISSHKLASRSDNFISLFHKVWSCRLHIQSRSDFLLFKQGSGCAARRSLAALEDQSSIPGAGDNNVLVTKSNWPTLASSVCYVSLIWTFSRVSEVV